MGALVQALLDFGLFKVEVAHAPRGSHTHFGFIDICSHLLSARHGSCPTWQSEILRTKSLITRNYYFIGHHFQQACFYSKCQLVDVQNCMVVNNDFNS